MQHFGTRAVIHLIRAVGVKTHIQFSVICKEVEAHFMLEADMQNRDRDKKRLKVVQGESALSPGESIGLRNSIPSKFRNITKIMDFLSREQELGGVRW